jgi:predicted phage terminase large subunit-like protein
LEEEARAGNKEAERDLRDLWYWRCATDLELFAVAYFPHYCGFAFNDFHRDTFSAVEFMERAVRRARAAPRGYAKSTLEALIKPIHDVCYGLEKYIVVVSATQDQANQKLRDIRGEVLGNAALVADYGIHFKTKKPGETQYTLHCGGHACLFSCYGSGVEIRGIRFGASRPSKIVVDDAEGSEESQNEALREKLESWYFQVISQIGDTQTNIVFIGTMLHRESLLAKLLKNPAYEGKLYKAVISWASNQKLWDEWAQIYTNLDNDHRARDAQAFYDTNEAAMLEGARVLWPEKESYLYLMKERIEKGNRAFMKEKQNTPLGGDEAIFEDLRWYRETSAGLFIEKSGVTIPWEEFKDTKGRFMHAYATLDPATGQTKARAGKKGDFSVILTGLKDRRGRLYVHDCWIKRAPPSKFTQAVFDLHEVYEYQKFGVETNLYRNLLLPNMVDERKRREAEKKAILKLPFYDIEQVENKEKRIYTLEPKTQHGWILFNRALDQEFINQLEAFPHADHDDGPDALEMLWGLVNNRYKASSLSMDAMSGR